MVRLKKRSQQSTLIFVRIIYYLSPGKIDLYYIIHDIVTYHTNIRYTIVYCITEIGSFRKL